MSCPTFEAWLEALDDGRTAPDGAHDSCGTCHARAADARGLFGLLPKAVPESPRSGAAFTERIVAAPRARPRFWLAAAAVPLAAAAAFAFYLRADHPTTPHETLPVARGGIGADLCRVHEVSADGHVRTLKDGDATATDPSLGFTVRGRAPGHPEWVGIFGVTSRGRVAWYYPAYDSASKEAELAPLPRTARTLPEQVSLPLGEGGVKVICWVAHRPWSVREADAIVERAVSEASDPTALEKIPGLGGEQKGVLLWFGGHR